MANLVHSCLHDIQKILRRLISERLIQVGQSACLQDLRIECADLRSKFSNSSVSVVVLKVQAKSYTIAVLSARQLAFSMVDFVYFFPRVVFFTR